MSFSVSGRPSSLQLPAVIGTLPTKLIVPAGFLIMWVTPAKVSMSSVPCVWVGAANRWHGFEPRDFQHRYRHTACQFVFSFTVSSGHICAFSLGVLGAPLGNPMPLSIPLALVQPPNPRHTPALVRPFCLASSGVGGRGF